MRQTILFVFLFLLICSLSVAEDKRVVTIESARVTEYIKRPKPVTIDEDTEETPQDVVESSEEELEEVVVEEKDNPEEEAPVEELTQEQIELLEKEIEEKKRLALEKQRESWGEEVIRFFGDVIIVVTEGSSVSRIMGDEIIYDKNRDTLEARGNVVYEHTTGKKGMERFSGQALLFDIKKQEGVFLSGIITQDSGKKDSDPYIIHAEVSGRDSSTTMAFKSGVLTTCDDEDPHWSIKASRIWLLPGNEIAILNGIFYIGPIPVFYIPFFYYPGDEMIVHPVFGYRNREGYFVQTTTYLYGRKPLPQKDANEGNTFADFLQGDVLKEQRREGLFLRNLEEDAKDTNPDYIKFLLDGYSSLGGMLGIQGSFTPDTYVRSVEFLVSAALSNTLYPPVNGLEYSTYNREGKEKDNEGVFFGQQLPVRYRTNLGVRMDKKPFQINIALPLVSDPEYKDDFFDRSEDLNWFKLLTDRNELAKDTLDIDETSYSWVINGSIRPDVSFLNPWLDTFSISSLSGIMVFNSKTNATLTGEDALYSPERKFYYPELIKPELRMNIAGTIFSTKRNASANGILGKRPDSTGLIDPFKAKQNDTTAQEVETPVEETPVEEETESSEDSAAIKEEKDRFIPAASNVITQESSNQGSAFSLTWAFDPSLLHETRYDSTRWNESADIDWGDYASLYNQARIQARLLSNYSYDTNFLTISAALNYTGTWQEHPWLSDEVYTTKERKDTVYLSDYKATVYTLSTTDSVTYKPFNRNELFKPVAFAWNFTGDMVKTVFIGTVDNPEWETNTFEWHKDYIGTHTAASTVGVAIGPYEQKFTMTSNLPPLLESYGGVADFAWLFGSLNLSTKLFEREDAVDTVWLWDPFRAMLTWNLPWNIRLSQEYIYNLEDEEHSRLHFTGSFYYLSAYYTLTNEVPYRLEPGQGWVLDGETKEFIPSAAGVSFNNSSKPLNLYSWHNRIYLQGRLSSDLKFSLLRLTDSSFTFSPSIVLKIHEFLDITFSATSSNEVIARYFQEWMDLPAPLPGESNLFVDLFNSFNFFDDQARSESGFKLKSLNLELTHYLHDWTMNLKTSITPELKTEGNVYRYEFIPEISFVVQWKPISDIKTTVSSKEGVFALNQEDEDELD